jgi:prepilin-type N-terminal cleavage/methylation domain-containing protein
VRGKSVITTPGLKYSKDERNFLKPVAQRARFEAPRHQEQMTARQRKFGFTLIELLVVIAIMAVLAALLFTSVKNARATRIKNRAKAELKQVETLIELYKSKLGHYPPSSSGAPPTVTPLFYELTGTRLATGMYTTLDGSSQLTSADVNVAFGLGGFVNAIEGAGSQDGQQPQDFAKGSLQLGQYLQVPITNGALGASTKAIVLGSTLEGSGMLPGVSGGSINPFGYNSLNPTNNPRSYDLWLDVNVNGVTYRFCNWQQSPVAL